MHLVHIPRHSKVNDHKKDQFYPKQQCDHDTLLPGLVVNVREGGVFAFQMPRNWNAPSHAIIHEVVATSPHREKLEPLLLHNPVHPPDYYYGLLKPYVSAIDIWETEYLQVLDGENAVAEWTKGSILKPLLEKMKLKL